MLCSYWEEQVETEIALAYLGMECHFFSDFSILYLPCPHPGFQALNFSQPSSTVKISSIVHFFSIQHSDKSSLQGCQRSLWVHNFKMIYLIITRAFHTPNPVREPIRETLEIRIVQTEGKFKQRSLPMSQIVYYVSIDFSFTDCWSPAVTFYLWKDEQIFC